MKNNKQAIKKQSANLALALCITSALVGCSSINSASNAVEDKLIKPAPDAGFIADPARQSKLDYLPFQKVWVDPKFNSDNYSEIVIAPVNTQYIQEMDWLSKMSAASWFSDVQKDIKALADYFQSTVAKEFKSDPTHRFTVLDSPVQHKAALSLEMALIEVNPSTPILHAAGWLAPGGGTAANVIDQRTVAFEARLRDMQTNQIVATFADRKSQDIAPIDLTNLTWYGPAKGIMDNWAKEFVAVANRKPGEKVMAKTAFTLKPF